MNIHLTYLGTGCIFKFDDEIIPINIKFNRFSRNFGITRNFLKAVSMASGEFVWTIGNDDLILPKSLKIIEKLLINFRYIDLNMVIVNDINLI